MSPRVLFDGSILAAGEWTGVSRSFVTTLRYWSLAGDRDALVVVPDRASEAALRSEGIDSIETLVEPGLRGFASPLTRQRLAQRIAPMVWHSPVAALPPGPARRGLRFVATVHDLPWRVDRPTLRELRPEGPWWRHRLALRIALRRTHADRARILVPSRTTAAQLDHPLDGDRILVAPPGIRWPSAAAQTDRSTRLGAFLVLGDDRARKNLARVREAHERARDLVPELPDLRIVGPEAGYVDESEKDRLLRSATALLHLSLHEGFGMPCVEAFVRGTPVICSDLPVLREVTASAAVLVDPFDEAAIAQALIAVHADSLLRDRLAAAGLARAEQFHPERSASVWCRAHEELLA